MGVCRESPATKLPGLGHFATEAASGRVDSAGSRKEGEWGTDTGIRFPAVRAVRSTNQAALTWCSPPRTPERPFRSPGDRPPRLWSVVGTRSVGTHLCGYSC